MLRFLIPSKGSGIRFLLGDTDFDLHSHLDLFEGGAAVSSRAAIGKFKFFGALKRVTDIVARIVSRFPEAIPDHFLDSHPRSCEPCLDGSLWHS